MITIMWIIGIAAATILVGYAIAFFLVAGFAMSIIKDVWKSFKDWGDP